MAKPRATSTKKQREQAKRQKKEEKLARKKARELEKEEISKEQVNIDLKNFIQQDITLEELDERKTNESMA